MNLDNKVLVDKDDLREAIQYVREVSIERSDWSLLYFAETLESALAQDLSSYALVPKEPTKTMLTTGVKEHQLVLDNFGNDCIWDAVAEAYRAMIAAAQKGE